MWCAVVEVADGVNEGDVNAGGSNVGMLGVLPCPSGCVLLRVVERIVQEVWVQEGDRLCDYEVNNVCCMRLVDLKVRRICSGMSVLTHEERRGHALVAKEVRPL